MCVIEAAAVGGSAAVAAGANAAIVAAATTAVTMQAQAQQARAQNRMLQQRQDRGTQLAQENYASQIKQGLAMTVQEREAAADEIAKVSSEGRKASSLAALSAGERGVSGQGIDQIYADFEAQELRYQTQVKRSLSFREQVIQDKLDAARRGAESNIANLQFAPRSGPNLLAGALQIGGAAFGAYQSANFRGPDPRSGTGVPNIDRFGGGPPAPGTYWTY